MSDQHLAPFVLTDQDGRDVRIDFSDGATLIYWYPMADTPGCIAQAEGLRDNFEGFEALGCRILGASFDAASRNRAFRDKYRLPFELLSDASHEVAILQGVVTEDASVARRVAFLVDACGRIVHRYDVDDPTMFAERVLDDLEGINMSRHGS